MNLQSTEIESAESTQSSQYRQLLRQWLNRSMKIKITDGRYVIGTFLCTDKHSNIILGSCQEFIDSADGIREPRTIGLSMIPGNHIISIHIDEPSTKPLTS